MSRRQLIRSKAHKASNVEDRNWSRLESHEYRFNREMREARKEIAVEFHRGDSHSFEFANGSSINWTLPK